VIISIVPFLCATLPLPQIPTKIEVYVGASLSSPPEPLTAAPKRLGYLSFDSNERSNHQARELKSVHVNVDAAYVRLVIHRCHLNKLNIYNQVGHEQLEWRTLTLYLQPLHRCNVCHATATRQFTADTVALTQTF
jgi:hypothetical protein